MSHSGMETDRGFTVICWLLVTMAGRRKGTWWIAHWIFCLFYFVLLLFSFGGKYNWSIINCIHLKCITSCILTRAKWIKMDVWHHHYSEESEQFHHPQNTPHPLCHPYLHPPSSSGNNDLLPVTLDRFECSIIFYKWNHTACTLFWLASFIQQMICRNHPCFVCISSSFCFIAE